MTRSVNRKRRKKIKIVAFDEICEKLEGKREENS